MNKLLLIIFVILTSTISCRQSTKNLNRQRFSNYLHKIEPMTLPYQTGCNDFINIRPTDKNSTLIDTTFSPAWEIPFKRIETTKNFYIVIFLMPADIYIPIIRTFDSYGKKISELKFFSNCSGEPGFRERQFVEIRQDFQIIKTDSIWRWELDDKHYKIESTKRIEVTRVIFEIDENGLINKKKVPHTTE